MAQAKRNLGCIAQARNELNQAEHLLEEATILFESVEDSSGLYWTTANLANLALQRDELERAWTLAERALRYARQAGHQEYAALRVWGYVERRRGNLQRAKEFWEQAWTQFKRINHHSAIAEISLELAQIEIELGQAQTARQMLLEALEACRKLDIEPKIQEVEELLASLSTSADQSHTMN